MAFKIKKPLGDIVIPHERFRQYRRYRDHPLFVVLSLYDNEIAVDIGGLDAAQLQTSHTSLKEGGQDRPVPDRDEIVSATVRQHLFHLPSFEDNDDRLILFTPLENSAGIEPAIPLIVAILDEGLDVFQDAVDIGALLALFHHISCELLHNAKSEVFHVLNLRPLNTKTQKEIEVIPVPPDGPRGVLSNLNLDEILSDGVLNFQDLNPSQPSIVRHNRAERVCHNKIDVCRSCNFFPA